MVKNRSSHDHCVGPYHWPTRLRRMGNMPRQVLSLGLSTLLILQPVMLQGASNIVVDDTMTGTSTASNGVSVVDIATPNSRGLSHNRYQHFNVDRQGAILNNSAANVSTQLAGWISGNSSLASGAEASLILNEVTHANRSQLDGAMEVAGNPADVVLASLEQTLVSSSVPTATVFVCQCM